MTMASITPIKCDMTDYDTPGAMARWDIPLTH